MLDGSTTILLSIYWICGSNTLWSASSTRQQEIFWGRHFRGNRFSRAGVWSWKLRKFLPRENFPLYGILQRHWFEQGMNIIINVYLYPAKYDSFAISLQLAKFAYKAPLWWSLGASFNVKRRACLWHHWFSVKWPWRQLRHITWWTNPGGPLREFCYGIHLVWNGYVILLIIPNTF